MTDDVTPLSVIQYDAINGVRFATGKEGHMGRHAIAFCLFVSTLGLYQDGPRASTDVAAPAIPGARAGQALGRICPKEAPLRIDCNGDGVLDSLVPSYHEGPFNHYMTPEMGAQFGVIGAAASMKASTGNQNFTQAGALAGPDGKLLWTFKAGAMINVSRVSAEDGRLYVASHDDILRALALDSGKVVWQQDLKGNILGLVGSREQIVAVSAKNDITAFRREDGTVLWRKPLKTAVMMSPNFGVLLADDSTLFVSALDNHVSALERASGERRWDFKTAGNASLRLLTGGTLLIAVQKELIALDAASGSLRWRVDVGGPVHAEPIADLGGQIVFLQPFGDSKLMALDPATGKVPWSVDFERAPRDKDRKIVMPEDSALYKSSLVVQRDGEGRPRLLLAADRGSVRAVQVADGKVLWSAPIVDTQALTLSGDRLVVVDKKKIVHSLDLAHGTEQWSHKASAQVSQLERLGDRLLATLYSRDLLVLDWEAGGSPTVVHLGEPYSLVRSSDDRLIVCSESGTWEYAPEEAERAPAQ